MTRLDITKLTYSEFPEQGDHMQPWIAMGGKKFNIASYLPSRAAYIPHQAAIVSPEGYDELGKRCYSHLTFAQLNRLSDAYAHGLTEIGFERGERTLLMVRQGLELIALTFALFKIGAVPILIDPGMGRKGFLKCIEDAKPTAMIGIPRAFLAKLFFGRAFRTVNKAVATRPAFYASAHVLADIARYDDGPFKPIRTHRDDLAAILFTSGSTGPAKGVQYTHAIFDAQVRDIRQMYKIEAGEVAVPGFPLFALFSTAMGMTCVIPDMDPSQPATANPELIVEAICDHGADMAFGSPAIWHAVERYCTKNSIKLSSITRLLTFGAPINPDLVKAYKKILVNGQIHTPYGATEALPISSISSESVLAETGEAARDGKGICVGKPIPSINLEIIAITDDPIESWSDVEILEEGQIGEVCVYGPQVTKAYDHKPEHNRLSKIVDGENVWHRMGDVGYLDDQGRLWYCGRKSHRVITEYDTLFTIPCEGVFELHNKIGRAALVGLGEPGKQLPVIIIQAAPGYEGTLEEDDYFHEELPILADRAPFTRRIETFLFHPGFPVDRRHNAKIHRHELAQWAARTLNYS